MKAPLLTAEFRVLVLRNDRAEWPHQRIEAICLELNHGGRGATVPKALEDLARTLEEYFSEVWRSGAPAHYDPDPEWVEVFENKAPATKEGDVVIDRYRLLMSVARSSRKAGRVKQLPVLCFEALVA